MHLVRLINQNRRNDQKQSTNPEEQIIKNRGRRELPRTPVRKSPRKRSFIPSAEGPTESNFHEYDQASYSGQPQPQASPFTKCLRSMILSPPRNNVHNRHNLNLRKRLLLSPNATTSDDASMVLDSSKSLKKIHYYSPISRKLRSSDVSENSSLHFDDSGIDLTSPSFNSDLSTSKIMSLIPEDDNMSIKSMNSSMSSTSSKKTSTSINRARRRFRF